MAKEHGFVASYAPQVDIATASKVFGPNPDGTPYVMPKIGDALSKLWVLEKGWNEADIPQRPWIVKGHMLRGSVTAIVAPGGGGKVVADARLGRVHGARRGLREVPATAAV